MTSDEERAAEEKGRQIGLAEAARIISALLMRAETRGLGLFVQWQDVASAATEVSTLTRHPASMRICSVETLQIVSDGLGEHCPGCGDSHQATEDQSKARNALNGLLEG